MTKAADKPPAAVPLGIARGQVLPLRRVMELLGIGRKSLWLLQTHGLVGIDLGRQKFFLSDDVIDTFARMARENGNGNGSNNA